MTKNDELEIGVLQHALGINESRSFMEYRNYFATESDNAVCLGLVAKGDMRLGSSELGCLTYFHVTDQGKVRARSHTKGAHV